MPPSRDTPDPRERLAILQQENEALRRALADFRPDERLRLEEERYRSLVQAITAIVWNTPASGEFETEQPGWSAFTGQTFAELSGWGWLNAVHPDDRPNTARVWSAAVASRSLYHVEHRLRRHDGAYRHMLVRAVPILNDAGAIREWVGVHTDVSEQKLAEAVLREAKAAAESANRTKSEFLANMHAGMDGYVPKPFQAQELYEAVEQAPASCLKQTPIERPLSESADHASAEAMSSIVSVEVVDWAAALKRVRGRSDMLKTLVSCLIKEITALMPQMREAAGRGDTAALVRPAHTLRGAAGACAAGMVQDAAGRLEGLARTGDSRGLGETFVALETEVSRLLPVLATFVQGAAG